MTDAAQEQEHGISGKIKVSASQLHAWSLRLMPAPIWAYKRIPFFGRYRMPLAIGHKYN